jgi:cytochrome c556
MASVMALLAATAFATGRAGTFDDETPTIKDVMGKLHKGANSPLAQLKKSLQGSPNWKDVQGLTKEFETLGAALPKDEPPIGKKDDYKMLATAYYDNAKALDDAAKKEDLAGAQAAFGKISTSCMPCHKTHRPR